MAHTQKNFLAEVMGQGTGWVGRPWGSHRATACVLAGAPEPISIQPAGDQAWGDLPEGGSGSGTCHFHSHSPGAGNLEEQCG